MRQSLFLVLAPPVLYVVLAWPALRENSATYDEVIFLPAGYTYLTRGDFRLGPDNPWLLKALLALPVLPLRPVVSPDAERAFAAAARDYNAQWIFGDRFLYQDNRPQELLFRARLVGLGLGAALVLLVSAWANQLFGAAGGLFAATLLALDPNFLAHGALATTDVGVTLFFTATLLFARRTLRAFTGRDATATALAAAAAVGAKFSAVLLVPAVGVLCLLRLADSRPWPVGGRRAVRSPSGRTLLLGALLLFWALPALGSLWVVYGRGLPGSPNPGFSTPLAEQVRLIRAHRLVGEAHDRGTPLPDDATLEQMIDRTPPGLAERIITACARWRLLPERYLSGLTVQIMRAESRPSFFVGRFSDRGSRAYFPLAFAVKTPTATLAVLAVALLLLLDGRSRLRHDGEALYLLAPAAVVALSAIGSHLNIGHRHILPLYPFLYVLAGSLPGELRRLLGRTAAPLVMAAVLLLAAETVAARPYFLSFFNFPAGGPAGGLRLLSDSNLDWGQGLPALQRWMRERGVERVNLCYFGSADPAAYGIRFVPLPPSYYQSVEGAGHAGYWPQSPELPGWVAIGATYLQGLYLNERRREAYAFLRSKRPAAVLAGGALYVYWVDRWGE